MAGGRYSIQASLMVVVDDSTLYRVALFALQGVDVGASVTLVSAVLFLAAGVIGTAVGHLAVFVGVDRVEYINANPPRSGTSVVRCLNG